MRTVTNNMKHTISFAAASLLIFSCTMPAPVHAAGLEVSGWIPYWRDSEGIEDALDHLSDIDRLHPFAFSVKEDGTLKDLAGLGDREWKNLIKKADTKNIEVVPTVMWSDGEAIHALLSNQTKRKNHINAIIKMVKAGRYDGVDIDYEAKLSETKDYFSLFLKELDKALGSKMLTCTIEARTPPESLYHEVPEVINYANDYTAIAKYCDRVEIMAYDQQRADIKLNSERKGNPYMPLSDVDWVEKVVKLALEDIPKEKIVLGVPTYGHQYTVTVAPEWFRDYKRVGAINLPDMLDIVDEYDVTPGRNDGGEMAFTYFPDSSIWKILKSLPVPKGTPKGMEAAQQALLFATMADMEVEVRYALYSDATAVKDKIDLAKKYKLRGVSVFKIDGEEDQDIWTHL